MSRIRSSSAAFTLLEIMVVVVAIGIFAVLAIPTYERIRQATCEKAIRNNLRQIAAAAQQYMLQYNVSSVGYSDLAGSETDKYLRCIRTVANEDYTIITIDNATTQITVGSPVITVSYNM